MQILKILEHTSQFKLDILPPYIPKEGESYVNTAIFCRSMPCFTCIFDSPGTCIDLINRLK